MKPITKIALLIIALVTGIAVVLVRRIAPAPPPVPTAYEKQENSEGDVTVMVKPATLKAKFPPSFDVVFDTHSVDLSFDVAVSAALTDSRGTVYTAAWEGAGPGGHHRSGTLRFTPNLSAPGTVALTLTDIAGISARTFTWDIE